MLVDNEEDNKTHRPVAPKDVSLSFSQVFVLKTLFITVLFFVFFLYIYIGSKETSSLPRQPGGDHQRWEVSTGEEGRGGGHEEDLR